MKKKIFMHNIQNVHYAIGDAIKSIGDADKLKIENDISRVKVRGDGRETLVLASDNGLKFTLGLTAINPEYAADMKRERAITGGMAEVELVDYVQHAIYYETVGIVNKKPQVIKVWLLNCTTDIPSTEMSQDAESGPAMSTWEIAGTAIGVPLMDHTGLQEYSDADGLKYRVFRMISRPGDEGYETFGDTVPTPKDVVPAGGGAA